MKTLRIIQLIPCENIWLHHKKPGPNESFGPGFYEKAVAIALIEEKDNGTVMEHLTYVGMLDITNMCAHILVYESQGEPVYSITDPNQDNIMRGVL